MRANTSPRKIPIGVFGRSLTEMLAVFCNEDPVDARLRNRSLLVGAFLRIREQTPAVHLQVSLWYNL